jgi:hypothetical protein
MRLPSKSAALLLTVAFTAIAWTHLRFADLEAEIAALKTNAATQAARELPAHTALPPSAPFITSTPPAPDEDCGALRKRLAELETTVGELTDAWNRFANDERERRRRESMRAWGPEQATGAPDSGAGDQRTAWASQAADAGPEWLEAGFGKAVEIAQVRVLENDNPGAITKIVAVLPAGGEIVIWQGEEPRATAPADHVFNAPPGLVAAKIRLHLDTAKVPGWNEIDAVELIGRDGSRQWAETATASSTYAQPRNGGFGLETFVLESSSR